MEMINRLNGDALDSQKFVEKLMQLEREDALMAGKPAGTHMGENRQERRARERAERNAAERAAKARP